MSRTAKRYARVIVLVVLISMAAVILFHLLGSSAALSRYKSELRAKGEKLTLAELAVPVSTNAEHIASRHIFFTNTFNPPTIIVRAIDYTAPDRARVAWKNELRVDSVPAGSVSGATVDWAALERQNESIEATLDVFRQALRNPAPDGWDYHNDRSNTVAPKMNYVGERNVSFGLLNAELIALHHGQLDGALTNLHALTGLARLNRNELTLVQSLIGSAIALNGLNGTWEALQAPGWSEEQLAALQHDWEEVHLLDMLERGFLGERANNQELMVKVRTMTRREFADLVFFRCKISAGSSANPNAGGFSGLLTTTTRRVWTDYLEPFGYRMFSVNEDELVQLRYFTETLEAIRLLKAGQPWLEVKAALEKANAEVEETYKRDCFRRLMVSRAVIPNYVRAVEMMAQRETQRRLTIAAIALKRYQLKYGKPPENLAALTPEFLPALLIDPMSGKALCYRANQDGTFTLYSVGLDGKDDGGQAGMGLWALPDAVWPTAVSQE